MFHHVSCASSPVEIDPPFNLTYVMLNESVAESGHSVLLSWLTPIESQVREGWITLVYELRFRHVAQPDNWRVRHQSVCSKNYSVFSCLHTKSLLVTQFLKAVTQTAEAHTKSAKPDTNS